MPWSHPEAFKDHEVRVDENHVPAAADGTHPTHVMGLKSKEQLAKEAPGSGSERWPNTGWTEAGDGTNYPGLPNQAQADAVVAQAKSEEDQRALEAQGVVAENQSQLPENVETK